VAPAPLPAGALLGTVTPLNVAEADVSVPSVDDDFDFLPAPGALLP
jgi:hypothetical protein